MLDVSQHIIEIPPRVAAYFDIRERPGWLGVWTDRQAQGAIANGEPIVKIRPNRGEGELHPPGATGRILGSIYYFPVGYMYFVEWDATPRLAVAIAGAAIKRRGT